MPTLPELSARQVEIRAGDFPRSSSIVEITNPANHPGGVLTAPGRDEIPCQRRPDGKLVFQTGPLKAGETIRFTFTEKTNPAKNAVAARADDQIQLSGNRPVATYQMAPRKSPQPDLDPRFLRGGYLHPLLTPSGKTVTGDYPANHLHHHGVWTAWTKTSFDGREPDFWNMGQGKGKVDFVSLETLWSGPVEAGLVSRHKFTDLTATPPVDVLEEQWTVRTYATGGKYHLIDLESVQTTTGGKPLELPVYHYGGLGFRGPDAWDGKDAAQILTSGKLTDRIKANSRPARWIAISGQAAGGKAGLAILSHPENFRAPQPVRIHPAEPFISFAPQTDEPMSIKPGKPYHSAYRFITFDGEPDAVLLESLWQDYAHPVAAEWID